MYCVCHHSRTDCHARHTPHATKYVNCLNVLAAPRFGHLCASDTLLRFLFPFVCSQPTFQSKVRAQLSQVVVGCAQNGK